MTRPDTARGIASSLIDGPRVDAYATSRARTTPRARWLRWLPALTLTAVLTITASAEYELARTVLDLSPRVAWALPVAVDSYVLAALRSRRDVPAALAVMAGALAASMAAHLTAARTPVRAGTSAAVALPAEVVGPAATAIMVVLVVVAWRVHVLLDHPDDAASPVTTRDTAGAASTPDQTTAPTPALAPVAVDTPPPWMVGRAAVGGPPPSTPPAATVEPVTTTPDTPDDTGQPDTPGTRPSTRATVSQQSDDEILATLDGTSPGIRALMRTHGIGQARAARLHRRTLTQTITHDNTSNTKTEAAEHESRPDSYQKNHDQRTTEIHSKNAEQNHKIQNEELNDQSAEGPKDQSHPCITDRVGPSRSVDLEGERPQAALSDEFAQAGEF